MTEFSCAVHRAAFMFLVATAACGGEREAELFQERDSAGVVIAESTGPRWGDSVRWAVDATPALDLASSGTGATHELFRVRDATRLADGRIAVANGGSNEIRVFGANGEALLTVGREGDGPGEFQSLESVHRYRGDSLIAFDGRSRRLTVFAPDGAFGRTARFSGFDGDPEELHPIRGGDLLLRIDLPAARALSGRVRAPAPVLLVDADGASSTEIARAAGYEDFHFDRGAARPPYGHDSHVAATDDLLFVGDGAAMEFRVYALDGTLERVVRIPGFDLTVPQSERDSLRAAMLAVEMPDFLRVVQEQMANEIPLLHPAYSDLVVDADGYVWLAPYRASTALSSDPRGWLVFTPAGEWLGTVRAPPNFDLYEVGSDYLLGRSRDELGVETVQLLRLTRR